MGLLSALGNFSPVPLIKAEEAPQVLYDASFQLAPAIQRIDRKAAMSIPAAAKCRNLIVNNISATSLCLYRKSTGEELGKPVWMDQPSASQPLVITMAQTVDALIWYGQAFWKITEQYADDGRPARFEFVPNHYVTWDLDIFNSYVKQYYVNGQAVPMSGLGSLVTFQSSNEGVLNYGAEVLLQAINIEKAASVNAATPMPAGVLKNNGADLPEKEVQGLLAKWKTARQQKAVAYLTQSLEFIPTQFSNRDNQMVESQTNMATQIARLMNVPAYYLSADQNTSMTYSNISDENKFFLQQTLQTYYSCIEQRLSMDDITRMGNVVKFDLDDSILRPDPMKRLEVTEKMLQLGLIDLATAQDMNDITPTGGTYGITDIQL